MGAQMNTKEWGPDVKMAERKRPPLVLHFRPTAMVHPSEDKQHEFRELLRKNLGGAVFEFDDDGPYGPQGTISGSGDGWDDCDA